VQFKWLDEVNQLLETEINKSNDWYVGFSGGLDSTVLLHIIAQLQQKFNQKLPITKQIKLTAIHIQHNLHPSCATWSEHCLHFCQELNIPLKTVSVSINSGASLENMARDARFKAFAQILKQNDILFLAHHQNDQAETVFLRLMRGSGILGLSAISANRDLGNSRIVRPLLNVAQRELLTYAKYHNLIWIDDPSNLDINLSRNLVRIKVIPYLQQFWSNVSKTLTQTAEHASEAQILLDELAQEDLNCAQTVHNFDWLNLPSLDLTYLRKLSELRQKNLIRYFLRKFTLMPDSKHWHGFYCLRDAKECAKPIWQLADGQMQRANNRIWWLANSWLDFKTNSYKWENINQVLVLPNNGQVQFIGNLENDLKTGINYQIRYRSGLEVVNWHNRQINLKRLLQEHKIPHFVRTRIPLLYKNEKLIAVANIHNPSNKYQLIWQFC